MSVLCDYQSEIIDDFDRLLPGGMRSPDEPSIATAGAARSPERAREETRQFLCLLDPGAHDFTFQTFDDNRCNGHDINGRLARSTSDRAEILRIYELGAGVYVTVNETDLTVRK